MDGPRPRDVPEGARRRLQAIETACSDAEHDLTTVLTQPTLVDPSHPSTARFRSECERVRQQVQEDPHAWTTEQGVADLEASWRALRSQARRTGTSEFSRWQGSRIRRAGRLLELARSDRGSPRSRSAQYFRGRAAHRTAAHARTRLPHLLVAPGATS